MPADPNDWLSRVADAVKTDAEREADQKARAERATAVFDAAQLEFMGLN